MNDQVNWVVNHCQCRLQKWFTVWSSMSVNGKNLRLKGNSQVSLVPQMALQCALHLTIHFKHTGHVILCHKSPFTISHFPVLWYRWIAAKWLDLFSKNKLNWRAVNTKHPGRLGVCKAEENNSMKVLPCIALFPSNISIHWLFHLQDMSGGLHNEMTRLSRWK